ncbi:hypothetical protein N9N67_12610, partial [Bacteriovoracaceae bacterium]|nr:hypothetical protein [Bacteriovoracaceae bacterium]
AKILDGKYDYLIPEMENCTDLYLNKNYGNFSNGISNLIKIVIDKSDIAIEDELSLQGNLMTLDVKDNYIILSERIFDEAIDYFQIHVFDQDFSLVKSVGGEGGIPNDHFNLIEDDNLFFYFIKSSYKYNLIKQSLIDGQLDTVYDRKVLNLNLSELRPLIYNSQLYIFERNGYETDWSGLAKYFLNEGEVENVDELVIETDHLSIGRIDGELVVIKEEGEMIKLDIYEESNQAPFDFKYSLELKPQISSGSLNTQVDFMNSELIVFTIHAEYKEEVFVLVKNEANDSYELKKSWQQFNQKWNLIEYRCCFFCGREHQDLRPSNSINVSDGYLYFFSAQEVSMINLDSGERSFLRFEDL